MYDDGVIGAAPFRHLLAAVSLPFRGRRGTHIKVDIFLKEKKKEKKRPGRSSK